MKGSGFLHVFCSVHLSQTRRRQSGVAAFSRYSRVASLSPFSCIQRAKIGKNSEGKSGNATSRFDSNGNQDRMKLADFNFLMVLGKGSFGKVRPTATSQSAKVHVFVCYTNLF